MNRILSLGCLTVALSTVSGKELVVGGELDDFRTISAALTVAVAGDVIVVREGTYRETIRSSAPNVSLRGAANAKQVLITASGTVLYVEHAGFTVENLIFDGQFGDADAVVVRDSADGFRMSRSEVRHSGQDCIDISSPRDLLIENSLIHHCLRTVDQACVQPPCPPPPPCATPDCRIDAHGIAAGAVHNLRVVNTEIHTFSGDGLQVDADRLLPGWNDVTVEGCEIWLEPLSQAIAGYAAGVVPGEDGIDTKTPIEIEQPRKLTISNTTAHGFRGGFERMSAFNLKENVAVDTDGITVYNSEIAFRIRGRNQKSPYSADVRIANAVIYDVDTAIRYEHAIDQVKMHHVTIGSDVSRIFDNQASHRRSVIDGRNVLVLRDKLPRQLQAWNNLAVGPDAFVDGKHHDYHLAQSSPAIDAGGKDLLPAITHDIERNARHWGAAPDIGAYEFSR